MKPILNRWTVTAVCTIAGLISSAAANDIARFADPALNAPPPYMFYAMQGTFGLYAGWQGPPYIQLESPLGTIANCTMHAASPMYIHPNGNLPGGEFTFYDPNQVEVLRVTFTNGIADYAGLRCGPQTGGSVQFTWSPNGVQLPPGLIEPLQGAWLNFEFHNQVQGPRGPQWTASFRCGAAGQLGDLNCDGVVDFQDINPFVQALSDPAGYAAAYPWCDPANADINRDGRVDFADINPFVALFH